MKRTVSKLLLVPLTLVVLVAARCGPSGEQLPFACVADTAGGERILAGSGETSGSDTYLCYVVSERNSEGIVEYFELESADLLDSNKTMSTMLQHTAKCRTFDGLPVADFSNKKVKLNNGDEVYRSKVTNLRCRVRTASGTIEALDLPS